MFIGIDLGTTNSTAAVFVDGELALVQEAGLPLRDATAELLHAAAVRARPTVDDLRVPVESAWRSPISTGALEGEVVLPLRPGDTLELETFVQLFLAGFLANLVVQAMAALRRLRADFKAVQRR